MFALCSPNYHGHSLFLPFTKFPLPAVTMFIMLFTFWLQLPAKFRWLHAFVTQTLPVHLKAGRTLAVALSLCYQQFSVSVSVLMQT
jgi:hypothetical protein